LQELPQPEQAVAQDAELENKVRQFCLACADDMNDDFNTAKVIANLFELAPVINGIKGGQIAADALSSETVQLLRDTFHTYLIDVLGMQSMKDEGNDKLDKVLQL